MSALIDHIALLLRALPYLPELVYPVVALAALTNGIVAGRVWRRLRTHRPSPRHLPRLRSLTPTRACLRSSPCRR